MKTCKKRNHQYEPIKGSENGCPECHELNTIKWKQSDPDYHKRYYEKNKSKLDAANKQYTIDHKEELASYYKEYGEKYRRENKDREKNRIKVWEKANPEKVKAKYAKYKKNNAAKVNATNMKRTASKINATPKWLSPEQLKEIEEFYTLAKELSWLSESPLEVDHIIPLRGKDVRGLHVPWNLQILPKTENLKKGNRL